MAAIERPSVFIGSSIEGLRIVDAIVVLLEHECELVPWTTIFHPGGFTLEQLELKVDEFDFAILVMTADDFIESRGSRRPAPRDNLLIELGLFIGRLGRRRTIVVTDRTVEIKLPTDLNGIIHASYSPPNSGNYRSALAGACVRIKDLMASLGTRKRISAGAISG
jgi:predicted nucleotide-binding protein